LDYGSVKRPLLTLKQIVILAFMAFANLPSSVREGILLSFPPSIRLITAWVVPALEASSFCVNPLLFRREATSTANRVRACSSSNKFFNFRHFSLLSLLFKDLFVIFNDH